MTERKYPLGIQTFSEMIRERYYWFDSGTPTFLIRQMKHFRTDITSLDSMERTIKEWKYVK